MRIYLKKNMYIPLLMILLFILSLIVEPIKTLIPGYIDILTSKSILITDYLAIGGLNSTLLNVFTTLSLNFLLVKILKLRITGPIFAGIMLLTGYSFFGINTINFIPIYLGIFVYSKIKKIEYRALIISIIFSCGIAGLISFIYFGLNISLLISIPLGILTGVLLGMIIPAIASHVIIFHSGYNLYNLGFTLGLISMIAFALFKAFGIDVSPLDITSTKYHIHLLVGLFVISIFFIVVGLLNKETIPNYKKLLKRSGRLVQDFIRDYTIDAVCLNIGINLLFCILLVEILNIEITGPLISGIFAIVGFSAMGKHIKNIIPVILGSLIAIFVTHVDINNVSVQIGIFFVTALSPLSGRYGIIIGLIAGFLHIIIAPLVSGFQGPFNLYLNGLIGGFIAAVLISIIESYEKEILYDR